MIDKFGVIHSDFPDTELPNKNIWQYLYPELKKWRNLTAFIDGDSKEELTYNELLTMSFCWAKELKKFFSSSTPPKVVLMLPNRMECLPVIIGCFAIGATLCPIQPNSTKEIAKIMIGQLKPEVLVTESSTYEDFEQTIKESGAQPTVYVRGKTSVSGVEDLNNILNSGECLNEDEMGQYDAESIALISYSSGTTGNPKGIMVTHSCQGNAVESYNHEFINTLKPADVSEQESIICNLPLAHIFGIQWYVLIALRYGHKVVSFDFMKIEEIAGYVKKFQSKLMVTRSDKIDVLNQVKNMDDLKSLRTILAAGAPVNIECFNEINRKLGNKIFLQQCYGATECNVITMTPLNQGYPDLSGKLISNSKAKFIDINTKECITKPYQLGEILFKGPGIMAGYLNNPEATKNAIDSDGWFHTGDIAYFDDNYFFKVIDRYTDLITVCVDNNKIKVTPSKIEVIIKQHPCVVDAGVIGIPHPPSGEEVPKAFVIRSGPVEEEELVKFVEDQVPIEMRLTGGVSFVQNLPRNHLGKLVRKFLRNMTWFN